MASVSLAQSLWLLFLITTVSAIQQYPFNYDDARPEFPYICGGETNITVIPKCCNWESPCVWDPRCGLLARVINATDAKEIVGTVNVVLDSDNVVPIKALASLNTRRNYVTSKLVKYLGLDDAVDKLATVDVHSLEIFGRNVTISTFVLLSIGVGIDDNVFTNKIFEIIPEQKSPDKDLKISNLTLSLNFLQDAGALAINQAIFTTNWS